MEEKVQSPATKGLVIALILIVLSLSTHVIGLSKEKWVGWLSYAIFGGAIIWSCIIYAKQNNSNVTFGNVFADGFKVSAAITGIIAVFTFISFKFIMPEMINYALEEARKGMIEKNMPSDQIEQALEMTKKFFIPFAIGAVVVAYLFFGAIFSLIGAAIAKKNPNYNPLTKE